MKTRWDERLVSRECGFTLVEMMAAVVVTVVVVAAGFTILATSSRATQANDQAAGTQQNARVAMELLVRDIKVAGFGFVGPVGACPTAIVPGDNNPAGMDSGPDRISLVVPRTKDRSAGFVLNPVETEHNESTRTQSIVRYRVIIK